MSQTPKLIFLTGAALAALGFGCRSSQPGAAAPSYQSAGHQSAGHQSAGQRTSRAVGNADQSNSPLMPDPNLTPGATLPVASGDICVSGYSKKVRNVPADIKQQVYAEYGITSRQPGEYEVDHLISLELGGSNSIKNLWPESYVTQPWNAHVKDKLENELHAEVCAGKIDLPTAQHEIATDWIASYKKHFNTSLPLSSANAPRSVGGSSRRRVRHPLTGQDNPFGVASASSSQVWVNLKSGKYFGPGSPYYGHTKSGQYMTEADAQKQGYIAARGQ